MVDKRILLSLSTPYFVKEESKVFSIPVDSNDPSSDNWHFINYGMFSEFLTNALTSLENNINSNSDPEEKKNVLYNKLIIEDYVGLTSKLHAYYKYYLAKFSMDSEDKFFVAYPHEDTRLTDFLHKVRFMCLKEALNRAFLENKPNITDTLWKDSYDDHDIGKVFLGWGISNREKKGYLDYKKIVAVTSDDFVVFGVQIAENKKHFRIIVETMKAEALPIAVRLDKGNHDKSTKPMWLCLLSNIDFNSLTDNTNFCGESREKYEDGKKIPYPRFKRNFRYKYFILKQDVTIREIFDKIFEIHNALDKFFLNGGNSKLNEILNIL